MNKIDTAQTLSKCETLPHFTVQGKRHNKLKLVPHNDSYRARIKYTQQEGSNHRAVVHEEPVGGRLAWSPPPEL